MSAGVADGCAGAYALVVGDETPDRAWTEGTLLQAGFAVASLTVAELGELGPVLAPRVVVLDDVASRELRSATHERIRAHPSLVGVPLLVLAYDSDIDSFSSAITRGAAAYLVKPVAAEKLASVVVRLAGWESRGDRTEKRRRLRRPLLMAVDVELKSDKRRVAGHLVDVSSSGCRIEVDEEVPSGEHVRVALRGHDASTHVTLGGEVRWHSVAATGGHWIGVRFTGTTALFAGKALGFSTPEGS
jgi:DNA-binding response OmpR family regulator